MGCNKIFRLLLAAFALTSGVVAASTLETQHDKARDDFNRIAQRKLQPKLTRSDAAATRRSPMNSVSVKISDARSFYSALEGDWQGRYHLWLTPTTPVEVSESSARLEKDPAKGSWVMRYRWAEGGRNHQGEFRFKARDDRGQFDWTDTFHSPSSPITGEGKLSGDGARLVYMSHYPVGEGQPDWGWRTELILIDAATFQLDAYNITPQGQEVLAVRCKYVRR